MTAGRLASASAGGCLALAVPTLVLLVLGAGESTPPDEFGLTGFGGLSFLVAFLAFAVIGAPIVARVPGNSVGPLLCAIGAIGSLGTFAYQYADYAIYVSPDALPGGAVFAWGQNFLPSAFGLLALALLVFPDGRLPSRRWRAVAGLAWAGVACSVIGYGLVPGPIEFPFEAVTNPFGVAGLEDPLTVANQLAWALMSGSVGLAGIAITRRLRRSSGPERQQLKWIGLAGAVAGLVLVLNAMSFFLSITGIDTLRIVVVGIVFAGFPIAAGFAILRYRLYDIDVVINRALVYTGLTATLAATYLAGVLLLQLALSPVTGSHSLAIAIATLAVAALFQPARRRIQGVVDRRFYRSKYDAARTLERFGARLRDEVDLDALATDLRAVVADTMQPAHVSLWLRRAEETR